MIAVPTAVNSTESPQVAEGRKESRSPQQERQGRQRVWSAVRAGGGRGLSAAAGLRPSQGGLKQRACACGGTPGPTGECAACRAQRLAARSDRAPVPHTGDVPEIARSRGTPLPEDVRSRAETFFRADFSAVRVHTGRAAVDAAGRVAARAFTVENDLYFGKGYYRPGTTEGLQLIGHELTHVLQQRAGLSRVDLRAVDDRYEGEAAAGGRALSRGDLPLPSHETRGQSRPVQTSSSHKPLQRDVVAGCSVPLVPANVIGIAAHTQIEATCALTASGCRGELPIPGDGQADLVRERPPYAPEIGEIKPASWLGLKKTGDAAQQLAGYLSAYPAAFGGVQPVPMWSFIFPPEPFILNPMQMLTAWGPADGIYYYRCAGGAVPVPRRVPVPLANPVPVPVLDPTLNPVPNVAPDPGALPVGQLPPSTTLQPPPGTVSPPGTVVRPPSAPVNPLVPLVVGGGAAAASQSLATDVATDVVVEDVVTDVVVEETAAFGAEDLLLLLLAL